MKHITILTVAILFSMTYVFAQDLRTNVVKKKQHPFGIEVRGLNDSNTDNVNRLAVDLLSASHTSSRIDSVAVKLRDGRRYKSTDIDGVDFERYFQWEDEGIISIELDFPKTGVYALGDSIIFYTVHGEYRFAL